MKLVDNKDTLYAVYAQTDWYDEFGVSYMRWVNPTVYQVGLAPAGWDCVSPKFSTAEQAAIYLPNIRIQS